MSMPPRGGFRTAARAALFAALACAGALARAAEPVDVRVDRRPDDAFAVEGGFEVDASSAAVWEVLADYERIPSFVSSMKVSRVREARPDGTLLVEQEAVGGMFFVSKKVHVMLEVERTEAGLRFDDLEHKDFWIYAGGWDVTPEARGTRVEYRLLAQPDFPAPGFLLKGVMRKGARDLLSEVRAEILRRARGEPSRTAAAGGELRALRSPQP